MEALLLVPTVILGYLYWRADRRLDQSQSEAQKLLVATLDEHADERKALRDYYEDARKQDRAELKAERNQWATERAQLLNRIQQPETAVYESFDPDTAKQYAGFDSDDEVWEAEEAMSVGDS